MHTCVLGLLVNVPSCAIIVCLLVSSVGQPFFPAAFVNLVLVSVPFSRCFSNYTYEEVTTLAYMTQTHEAYSSRLEHMVLLHP